MKTYYLKNRSLLDYLEAEKFHAFASCLENISRMYGPNNCNLLQNDNFGKYRNLNTG